MKTRMPQQRIEDIKRTKGKLDNCKIQITKIKWAQKQNGRDNGKNQ